jgi:CTP-dependent riboflavin kinase
MTLEGKIKSGLGEASFWVKKIEKIFEEITKIKLFPGTLNIELNQEYNLKNPTYILTKEKYKGTENLYIKECILFGHKSFIIRTEKNSTKEGDHPLNIIEIVSDINFRKSYNLKDGDSISILEI